MKETFILQDKQQTRPEDWYKFTYYTVGLKISDIDLQEDLTQEAMLILLRVWGGIEIPLDFSLDGHKAIVCTYIKKIVKSVLRDHWRYSGRQRRAGVLCELEGTEQNNRIDDPAELYELERSIKIIEDVISTLTPNQQDIINITIDGTSNVDGAKSLNQNFNTYRNSLWEIRGKFKRSIKL